MSEYGNYSGNALEFLKSKNIRIGDYVATSGNMTHKGMLMSRYEDSAKNILVLKLENGYNVGIKIDDVTIKKLQTPDLKINTKEKTIPKIPCDALDVLVSKDSSKTINWCAVTSLLVLSIPVLLLA